MKLARQQDKHAEDCTVLSNRKLLSIENLCCYVGLYKYMLCVAKVINDMRVRQL